MKYTLSTVTMCAKIWRHASLMNKTDLAYDGADWRKGNYALNANSFLLIQ